ncbi:putative flavoprotein CzcO associated with the cation diffusion facilitator CzcD [Geosmithia morbida]|uniref:Flavoprotein CzcO associated with the cation diffusion facilitator CzcD n=1 Tax=Geosmithia morbida TaxID=1094350 RepID=A0A9P4Z2Y7_9HYPO|nr:putative flavoprotein CzcO associated with the cation diffusion facilitator CzcD [Geosmithia morbida]KAF4126551.1 putative flavoprotein CzcO associated with the cation diffusion facilitator CzcD [Geosmithia morbida]
MTTEKHASVLIIGCGPAGLGAIEQFKRRGFNVVAYEARDGVGGLWNFDPNPSPCYVSFDKDGHPVALTDLERSDQPAPSLTPMYGGVTANTPKDVMPYRSHPYPPGTQDSPKYDVIYQYQKQHAAAYTDYIRFNRVVTRLRHTPPDHALKNKWLVEWTPPVNSGSSDVGKIFEEGFDHVVVANGSDTRPFIPYTENLWLWKGDILHSRWYREAKAFAGKTVLVVGAGPSSADIVRELGMLNVEKSPLAPRKVYRALRSGKTRYDTELEKGWADYIKNIAPIQTVESPSSNSANGRIITTSGETLDDVDVIIFATGFLFRFEFCRPSDTPFDKAPLLRYTSVPPEYPRPPSELVGKAELDGGHRVHNLDAHQLFYLPDPTLAFLLLHAEAIPWPFSEMQARVVAAHWSGTKLDLAPHPEEESDSHSVLVLGHPGEQATPPTSDHCTESRLICPFRFEYAEKLLALIGEGGPEEVAADGRWGAWSPEKKHIRELID